MPEQVAEKKVFYQTPGAIEKHIRELRKKMETAAQDLDFIKAAQYRDMIKELQDIKNNK